MKFEFVRLVIPLLPNIETSHDSGKGRPGRKQRTLQAARSIDVETEIDVADILKVNVDIDPWVFMLGIGFKF